MRFIADDIMENFEQMVSVPCFLYNVRKDHYLTISESLRKIFDIRDDNAGFCAFLERMHPDDKLKILSTYSEDVCLMMQCRKGEHLPKLRDLEFRIRDTSNQWHKSIVKIDIAGYDDNGVPEKLFGIFWSSVLTPALPNSFDHLVDDLYGEELIKRFKTIKQKALVPLRGVKKKEGRLTGREREVLDLIAHGWSTKEIALKLSISFHTVESHRKNLLTKFNARNSAELLALFKNTI